MSTPHDDAPVPPLDPADRPAQRPPAPPPGASLPPLAPATEGAEHRPWVTNLVLLALVLALGAWVLLGEPAVKSDAALETERRKLLPSLRAEDVVAIEVEQGGARLLLTRDPSSPIGPLGPTGWQVEAPVRDRGDDAAVRRLVSALQWAEAEERITGDALEDYPFGDVVVEVRVATRDGRERRFAIGAPRPGKVVPVRVVGGDGVAHVPEEFDDAFLEPADVYRSKELFTPPTAAAAGTAASADVEQVRVAHAPGLDGTDAALPALVLARSAPASGEHASASGTRGEWRVGSSTGERATPAPVEELITTLRALRAVGVAADAPDAAALERFGLAPARSRVALTLRVADGDREEALDLGGFVTDRPQERYARLSRRPEVVYRVNVGELEAALAKDAADYLSPRLFPVEGGKTVVTGLGARSSESTLDGATRARGFRIREEAADVWRFEGPGDVIAATPAAEDLAERLLELRIRERLGSAVDEAALGLAEPALQIELVVGEVRHEVHVGKPQPGQPGVYYVKRLSALPGVPYFAYTAELAEVPVLLAEAPLDLLERSIFKASSWDAIEVVLERPVGEARFRAEKLNPDPRNPRTPKRWQVAGQPTASHDELSAFLKAFDDVSVQRWVARVSPTEPEPAVLARFGLSPAEATRLTVVIETFKGNAMTAEARVLWLGRREGDSVFALREGGPAVGLIDAGFLDRLERGFAQGLLLFEVDKWNATRLVVRDGDVEALDLHKPEYNWKRGRAIVEAPEQVEDLLDGFARVELIDPEPASAARLAETGLATPTRRVEITVQVSGQAAPETRVLLIGGRAGPREVWAMQGDSPAGTSAGQGKLGRLYDEPLRAVDRYLARHPGPGTEPDLGPGPGPGPGPAPFPPREE